MVLDLVLDNYPNLLDSLVSLPPHVSEVFKHREDDEPQNYAERLVVKPY